MLKNKLKYIFLIILLFLSRILFISNSADFFDATQYIRIVTGNSLIPAITSGHPPFHPLYIAFGNIFYKILLVFGIENGKLAAILPSVIFGSLAIIVFYHLIKKIFDKKIALLSSIIVSIVPFIWISNITVLIDSTGFFFLLLSFYLYWIGLIQKKDKYQLLYILFSGISFGLAIFAHTAFGMWIPVLFAIYLYKQIKDRFRLKDFIYSLIFVIGPLIAIFMYLKLLIYAGLYFDYKSSLKYLVLGNIGDNNPFELYHWLRNYLIQLTALSKK